MAEVTASASGAGSPSGAARGGRSTAGRPNRSGHRRGPGHASTPRGSGSPPRTESEDRRLKGGAVLARYRTRCQLCQEAIDVDDLIVDYDGEWVHERCAEWEAQIEEDAERLRDGVHIDQQALDVEPDAE